MKANPLSPRPSNQSAANQTASSAAPTAPGVPNSSPSPSTQRKRDKVREFFRLAMNKHKVEIQESPHFARIGIAGGMGTEAGIDTTKNIMVAAQNLLREKNKPVNDQALPSMILLSDAPAIFDRTAYLKEKNVAGLQTEKEKDSALLAREPNNPLWGMLNTLKKLNKNDAQLFVVPCNTAHAWAKFYVQASGKMQHVHIVDATIDQLMKMEPLKAKLDKGETVRLGLMATDGTVGNQIYQDRLAQLAREAPVYKNIEFVTPDQHHQKKVMTGIYDPEEGVKSGHAKESEKHFHAAADHLKEKNVDALVQACTEIPLGMPGDEYKDTPVINPNTALAQSVVERAYEMRQAEIAKGGEPSRMRTT